MQIIRPEVREAIWRFRDAIIGIAISMLGLYWAINGVGFMVILGTSMALAGALLVFAGIQRGRFRGGTGGKGVVHVLEGQVTYYGPIEGGSVVISDLDRVELDPSAKPAAEWILHDPSTTPLRIPTDAEGADSLFDVFAGLDGIQTENMLAMLQKKPDQQVVVWSAQPKTLH